MEQQSKDPAGPAENNNHNTNHTHDNDADTNINSLLPKKRTVPLPRPGELLIYDCRPPPSHTHTPMAATFLLQENDTSLSSSSSPLSSGSNASAAQMAFTSPPTTPTPAPQEATFTRDDSNTTDQGMFSSKRTKISYVCVVIVVTLHCQHPPCCSFMVVWLLTPLSFVSIILSSWSPCCSSPLSLSSLVPLFISLLLLITEPPFRRRGIRFAVSCS